MTQDGVCDQKHRGCVSELLAAAWLLGQGYEVFRNVSAHGAIDIVAIKDGEVTLIDVKTARAPYRFNRASKEQDTLGVRVLCVAHSGKVSWATTNPSLPKVARPFWACPESKAA